MKKEVKIKSVRSGERQRLRNEFGILAGLLIASGFLLLLERAGFFQGIHKLWPVFLSIIGIGLIILFNSNKKDVGLLWLGSFMIMISIFFFFLNFSSWAYLKHLWPVFLTIISISILTCCIYNKKKIFLIVGIFGILLSAAFILIFGISASLWPVSLIITGLFIYIISIFDRR